MVAVIIFALTDRIPPKQTAASIVPADNLDEGRVEHDAGLRQGRRGRS